MCSIWRSLLQKKLNELSSSYSKLLLVCRIARQPHTHTHTKLRYDAILVFLLVSGAVRGASRGVTHRWSRRLERVWPLAGGCQGHGIVGHVADAHSAVSGSSSCWQPIRWVILFFVATRTRARRADAHRVHVVSGPVPVDGPPVTRSGFCSVIHRLAIHRFFRHACKQKKNGLFILFYLKRK